MSTSSLAAGAGLCLLVGAGFPATGLAQDSGGPATASPIQHLVVIFQENVSFDHYFATYPVALNPTGEPFFRASDDTPSANGLGTLTNGNPDGVLLTDNPNASNTSGNGANAINPFRLDRSQASTCDQDHNYGDEQKAFDQGLMDLFPGSVGVGSCTSPYDWGKGKGLVMGYFDGNTPLDGIQGRCSYGPRLPLVVISPFAKANFVDHTLTDQSSVLRFIEENWGTGQIGGGSFDQLAGPFWNMFDFEDNHLNSLKGQRQLILDPTTGQPSGKHQ